MKLERHLRVKEVFLRVCDLEGQQLLAALDSECGTDADLRHRVEAMLSAEERRPDFLEATGSETADPVPLPRPEEIGPAARALFASFLALRQAGRSIDIDELCASHPELRNQLKALHADWTSASATHSDTGASPPGATHGGLAGSRRYDLREEVARGGMGAILKVWDRDLQRNLAMKVILLEEDLSDGKYLSPDPVVFHRFLEEAQITGQLDHPGVVPVHELGTNDRGQVFFTMRLVKGQDFEQIIELARSERQGWTKQRALATLQRVCETMAYAHAKRVVHRDLKPANVMVGQFGETYVMDWGLARVLDDASGTLTRSKGPAVSMTRIRTTQRDESKSGTGELTQEGSVIGTPCYMSPEQAFGKLDEIGPSSDVYSVGSMLYQLLTGCKPYTDEDRKATAAAVIAKLRAGPPTPVYKLAPDVPTELCAICEKAMAREQAQRYPTMVEMADDLRAYMERRVVRAHETGAVAEFKKWVQRNKGMAAALASLILLALASLVTVVLLEQGKTRAISVEQEKTRAALVKATEQTYVANLLAADLSLKANDHGEAKRALDACPEELRGWEWDYLHLLADTSRAVLDGHGGPVTAVAVDPNGQWVATGDDTHRIQVWNAVTGERHGPPLEGHEDRVMALAFTGRGDRLISVGGAADATIRVWNVLLGAEEGPSVRMAERAVGSVVVEAESGLVAVGTREPAVVLLHVGTGEKAEELRAERGQILSLALAGDRVFAGFHDGRILAWTRGTAEATTIHASTHGPVCALAYQPHSAELAAGLEDGTVVRLAAESGRLLEEFQAHPERVSALAYDGQGRRLVTASFDKSARTWELTDGTRESSATKIEELHGHENWLHAIALSSDGEWVVTGSEDRTARLWQAGLNTPLTLVDSSGDEEGSFNCIAVHPAGLLAVGSIGSGRVQINALPSGQLVKAVFAGEDGQDVNSVAFSPDGKLVAAAFEGEVRVWNSVGGEVGSIPYDVSVRSVAFGPDGETLYSASHDGTVRAWNVRGSEEPVVKYEGDKPVETIAVSAAGDQIAVGCLDGTVALVDLVSESTPRKWPASETALQTVAFDLTGKRLATAGSDWRIRIWNLGRVVEKDLELEGHDHSVESVAFNEDGKRLVSGSLDGKVRIWDALTGRALLTLQDGDERIHEVLFTPDGERIVSMSWQNIWIRSLGSGARGRK